MYFSMPTDLSLKSRIFLRYRKIDITVEYFNLLFSTKLFYFLLRCLYYGSNSRYFNVPSDFCVKFFIVFCKTSHLNSSNSSTLTPLICPSHFGLPRLRMTIYSLFLLLIVPSRFPLLSFFKRTNRFLRICYNYIILL